MEWPIMSDVASAIAPRSRAGLSALLEVVRQFTPNWFAATMGTGILALALAQFPLPVPGLKAVAEGLWFFNIGLFALFSLLYAARWVLFPRQAARIFSHSVMSMFFGCVPMGLATIINGFLTFGIARMGVAAVSVAEALWWFDAALAVLCGVAIPFMMFTRQQHALEQMTAIWLLPVVAAEVAAVGGGLLAPHLADADRQLTVLVLSYALWAFSVPIAMSILAILLLRLVLHKLPHAGMAASSWLALGPIGTGALGLTVLGSASPAVLAAHGLGAVGPVAQGLGVVGGLMLWGYGLWWAALALLITVRYLREGLPFNLGWWGYTFPIGVYAVATLKLANILPIPALADVGGCLVAALAILWVTVSVRTVQDARRGKLFVSPCLIDDRRGQIRSTPSSWESST
jgi:C4-dicarboxylate transporter/malic acid transport protein